MSNSPRKSWSVLIAAVYLALTIAPVQASSAWGWPLDLHELSLGFDRPVQNWLPGHRGVDLVGAIGDEVLAAGAGTIFLLDLLLAKVLWSSNMARLERLTSQLSRALL